MLRGIGVLMMIVSLGASASPMTQQTEKSESGVGVYTRLNAYREAYPEINFVQLRTIEDLPLLYQLVTWLGHDAENVDYEHPPEVRQILMEAQVERIGTMLVNHMPSSTLFKAGKETLFTQPYVCVVTLDEAIFTHDLKASTRFFGESLSFEPTVQLDNQKMLGFTLDHEVFHCLDAYLNGPTYPRTKTQLATEYNNFRAEQRADLYAGLAYLAGGNQRTLLRDFVQFRTMSLVEFDLPHYTVPALRAVLQIDNALLRGTGIKALVRLAMNSADHQLMSREQHKELVAAALEVAWKEGRGDTSISTLFQEMDAEVNQPDKAQVQQLLSDVHEARSYLGSRVAQAGQAPTTH